MPIPTPREEGHVLNAVFTNSHRQCDSMLEKQTRGAHGEDTPDVNKCPKAFGQARQRNCSEAIMEDLV
ncbi:hypothetical protein EYF80_006637 [Liparis tanakae]|uniref:Uncharacterized protein n=1 Tax=Liparis tanakae TaxID=230148 RepID=A0A4Z2IYG9_9TELE|nr:hypothetical protein EYF80_006637 [Liparis tanakae]